MILTIVLTYVILSIVTTALLCALIKRRNKQDASYRSE